MAASRQSARWWRNRSLATRLLIPVSIAIAIGAVAQALLSLKSSSEDIRQHMQVTVSALFDTLSPLIIEQAIIGDYATIEQLLNAPLRGHAEIAQITWSDRGDHAVRATGALPPSAAPSWFQSLARLELTTMQRPLRLGGTDYGELKIAILPRAASDHLWEVFKRQIALAAGAVATVCLIVFAILRSNLQTLRELASAADRFRGGDTTVQIASNGALEVRTAAHAFNNMARQIEKLLGELAQHRQELRTQLEFSQTLVNALPNPVYFTDHHGHIEGVNRAWEHYLGVPNTASIGKTFADFLGANEDFIRAQQARDRDMLDQISNYSGEVSVFNAAGQQRHALLAMASFRREDGRPAGIIGSLTDVTQAREAEERVRSALVAKLSAERASEVKSAFLANMSHEIRTPLTAILGFAEAMLDSDHTMEERIHFIHTIISSGHHLLKIINDILDLSKVEAQKLEIDQHSVALLPLLEDVNNLVGMQASDKGIDFVVEHVHPLPREILTDPIRVKQILINLCANAVKFTTHGSVRLRVRFDRERDLIYFEIIDTGIGLSKEQIARLFTPFSQADASTTRRFGGTGLGLYLSKTLAEKLGGTITVESTPDVGSRFVVSLPAGSKAVGNLSLSASAVREPLQLAHPRGHYSGRILLAEDNVNNQRLIAFLVRKLGANLTTVDNGQSAVDSALAQPYDLILMDMQMPVMDGVTATRRLRERGYQNPIVALTANAMRKDVEECQSAGCNGFLGKPIDRTQFFETVSAHLTASEKSTADDRPIVSSLLDAEPEMADLVRQFVEQLPGHVGTIEQWTAARDWKKLRTVVHDLKGSGGNFGFQAISALCAKLEFEIAKQDHAGATALVADLARIRDAILLGSRAGTPKGQEGQGHTSHTHRTLSSVDS